ncbi:MAG: SMC-Scp complex subunit ScpB [Alistipes sp.]|nr:SMC-Scp complex subunit ScpB [Alistipes sp.]
MLTGVTKAEALCAVRVNQKWKVMDLELERMEAVIEAVLFTMGDSVETDKLAVAIEQDVETTRKIIRNMMDKYEAAGRGIKIIELEDAFQLCTKAEYYENLIKVASQPKKYQLTDVLLETLSIIAYKQPITKLEIEKIRGVSSDHAVNKLVEYDLVCEVGRLDAPGRPMLFGTTEDFLRAFGVQSVEDLPTVSAELVEEFKVEAEEEIQLKLEVEV